MNSVKPIKNKVSGAVVYHYEINNQGIKKPVNDNINFKMDTDTVSKHKKKRWGCGLFDDVKKIEL